MRCDQGQGVQARSRVGRAGATRDKARGCDLRSGVSARVWFRQDMRVTERDREVVENTQFRCKIKSKLTNFMKLIQIKGYNGK